MLIIADQCTLAIHINDSEHMSRYVGSSHALTNTIHEEEKISSTRLQHSNLANQSEISIILCQPIRIRYYLVTLLQFVKICSIVLIDAATNQR